MRRRWASVLCAIGFAASADPLADGYAWLASHQDARGAFGATSGENEIVATHEALEALSLAPGFATSIDDAQLFLGLSPASSTNELNERRASALKGTAFALGLPVTSGHAAGFDAADPWAIAWTLIAARRLDATSAAEVAAMPRAALAFALPNGCFAVADNDASVELTALLVRAFKPFIGDGAIAFARAHALLCLGALQQPGGGFGAVSATATAALAFAEADSSYGAALASARSFLVASQHADGSWGSVRETALALQAFSGAPDWMMPLQGFTGRALFRLSATQVTRGSAVTAFIDVKNVANNPAPAAPLRVRAVPQGGGASIELGSFTVPALAAGQTITVTAALATDALNGRYQLEAEVDPLRVLPELDRSNNISLAFLNVVVGNDLSIALGGISFTALRTS